jgi:hypothetical protein
MTLPGTLRPWLGFALVAAVLIALTPPDNGYDGPRRLAVELLQGRTYLPEFVPWIEMFRHDGRDYVAYPPMVSVVLVPYVWITRGAGTQPLANTLFILGSAALLYRLVRSLKGMEHMAPFAVVAYALGTPNLYSARAGDVWLLMHSEGNFFLLLALVCVVAWRRYVLAGLAFMIAVQTRYVLSLAAPVFGLWFWLAAPRQRRFATTVRAGLAFTAGALPPLLLALGFQWWTLGDPFMSPYEAGWREWGLQGPQFALRYLHQNLPVYTWAHPTLLPRFPFLRFDISGQSIFVMSPFFFGLFLIRWELPFVRAFLPSVIAMTAFYLVYFGSGYAQFGARYMQDLYPLLIPLALSAFSRPGRGWRIALVMLLAYSIAMNAYGTFVRFAFPD